jgi:hypothetical protein
MQRKFFTILLFVIFFTVRGYSQTFQFNEASFPKLFSNIETPSYITLGQGLGNIEPLVYEANFSPEFRLSVKQFEHFGVVFTPQMIIRMYDQYSHPVRTPSYMPRGTLFYHFEDGKLANDQFVYFTLGHHSNGQDGNLFQSDSVTLNKINGSFASNYLSGGYEILTKTKGAFNPINTLRFTSTYYLIKNETLRNMYGALRFFGDVESTYSFPKERSNIFKGYKAKSKLIGVMHLGWIALDMIDAKPIDLKRLIFSYTLSYQPGFFNDVAVFARFYYGQDYYNINFDRTLTNLQFGFSIRNFSF